DLVVFQSLSKTDLVRIVDLELSKVAKRLKDHEIELNVSQEAKDLLIEKGYDEKYGARPLRRAVEHYLEDPLAEAILRGDVMRGSPIQVMRDPDSDKLEFRQKAWQAA